MVTIRQAELVDAPALADLLTELGFPAAATTIADRLARTRAAGEAVLVAVSDAGPIGLLTAHVMPVLHRPTPVGRITTLVVASCARRQGIGRALVNAAETSLAQRGCGLVEVTSNIRLTEAHGFYERLGYGVTSLRFKKSLPLNG